MIPRTARLARALAGALIVCHGFGDARASEAGDAFAREHAAGGAHGCLTPALHQVHARWGELSAAERDAVALATDPFYAAWVADGGRSWLDGDADEARAAARATCLDPTALDGFADYEGVGASDRVALFVRSGTPEDPALVAEVLAASDRALDALFAQGWRLPAGLPLLRVPLLLDDLPASAGGFSWWAPCAAAPEGRVDYVVLSSDWAHDEERRDGLLAHELFHAVQRRYAFDEYVTGFDASDSRFWVEASAVYVEGIVVPEAVELPAARSAQWSETPFAPLAAWGDATSRQYASFVFPLGVEQAVGGSDWHRALWERLDGRRGFALLGELDAELCAQGLRGPDGDCGGGVSLQQATQRYLAHGATMDLPRGEPLLSMLDLPAAVGRDGGWAARTSIDALPLRGGVEAGAAAAPGSHGGSYVIVELGPEATSGQGITVDLRLDATSGDGAPLDWEVQLVATADGAVVQTRALGVQARDGEVVASGAARGIAGNADALYVVASPVGDWVGAGPGWSWTLRARADTGTTLELTDGAVGCGCAQGSRSPAGLLAGALLGILGPLRRRRSSSWPPGSCIFGPCNGSPSSSSR